MIQQSGIEIALKLQVLQMRCSSVCCLSIYELAIGQGGSLRYLTETQYTVFKAEKELLV